MCVSIVEATRCGAEVDSPLSVLRPPSVGPVVIELLLVLFCYGLADGCRNMVKVSCLDDGCDLRFHPLCGLVGHAQPHADTFKEGVAPFRNWLQPFTGPAGQRIAQTYCHQHHPAGYEWDEVVGCWRAESGMQVWYHKFVFLSTRPQSSMFFCTLLKCALSLSVVFLLSCTIAIRFAAEST